MIQAVEFSGDRIAHGFFTREGGHSTGIYSSLNCGLGSGDDVAAVTKNRAVVAARLGIAPTGLVSGYQVHGNKVAVISAPPVERPQVDALVTAVPGLAIGILTADCGPILFADSQAGVVGCAHAGWKGALTGVYKSTVEAMEGLGARREDITAILGPTISQAAYEVGPEFPKPFIEAAADNRKYFIPSVNSGHHMFDLPSYLVDHMRGFGIGKVAALGLCTYADEKQFFSYRRTTHRGEKDYGRQISAIAIKAGR